MAQVQSTRGSSKLGAETKINSEQSQKLVQSLISMSLGCVAFLRNLFSDDNFIDQRFVPEKVVPHYDKNNRKKKDTLKVKTLKRGVTKEADVFLDWIESGIFDAIDLDYLDVIQFSIFTDASNPTDLIESYVFKFNYNDKTGDITLDFKNNHEPLENFSFRKDISLLDARKSVQSLMRRFIVVTQSLDPLPDEKYLSMRLLFNKNCPPNYQPPYFRDCSSEKTATVKILASDSASDLSIGDIATPHHNVQMKILSLPDNDGTDIETTQVDPFDLFETTHPASNFDKEYSDPGKENNLILIPDRFIEMQKLSQKQSQLTKGLQNFLNTSQNHQTSNIYPTQSISKSNSMTIGSEEKEFFYGSHKIAKVNKFSKESAMCECHSIFFEDEPGDTFMSACVSCNRIVHKICYGFQNNNNDSDYRFKCYTCLSSALNHSLPLDISILIQLRKLWLLFCARGVPDTIQKCAELLKLKPDEDSLYLVVEILNRLILARVLIISNEPTMEYTRRKSRKSKKTLKFGSNYINIDIDGIFEVSESTSKIKFIKQGSYGWTFYPAISMKKTHKKSLEIDSVKRFYFPEKFVDDLSSLKLIYNPNRNSADELSVFSQFQALASSQNDIEDHMVDFSNDSISTWSNKKSVERSFSTDLNEEFSRQITVSSPFISQPPKVVNVVPFKEERFHHIGSQIMTFEDSLQLLSQSQSQPPKLFTDINHSKSTDMTGDSMSQIVTLRYGKKRPMGPIICDSVNDCVDTLEGVTPAHKKLRKVSVTGKFV